MNAYYLGQRCLLSSLLFSIYAEMMMIETMEDVEEGVIHSMRRDTEEFKVW